MQEQLTFQGFGESLAEKVQHSIELMRAYEPQDGYYLGFSGGKDSCVLRAIADMAGVKYDANYNVTTIDPPELIQFMRQHHPDVIWQRPDVPLWRMVEKKGLPTRRVRWCCAHYKEGGGKERVKALGIRAAESKARAGRWKEITYWKRDLVVCPLYFWTDTDLWTFIDVHKIPVCSLYADGFKRLGCIGCPMARKDIEFKRWPRFERNWRKAANTYWEDKKGESTARQFKIFPTADEWFDWWVSNESMPTDDDDCQMGLFQ